MGRCAIRIINVAPALVLLVAILRPYAAASQETRPAFRAEAQTVAVYVTVRDRDGRLVPDLTKSDFSIFDNRQLREITTFSNDVVPITAVMLLDMSSSMGGAFLRMRDFARRFVGALSSHDRLRIGTFGNEVALSPHLTNDPAVLERILDEELWGGGRTPIWRASIEAMDSLASESGRRIILLLTDAIVGGGDVNCAPYSLGPVGPMGPCPDASDVMKRAQQDGFMFYAMGFDGPGLDIGVLVKIADDTGGGHFTLSRASDLSSTVERVAEELRHQYVLGFRPAALDGSVHSIEVSLANRELTARARKSYVAGRGK